VAQGLEEKLNLAAAMNAYTLTDRATWANFKNRRILKILTEGDSALFDTFGNHPYKSRLLHAGKIVYARIWHEWLTNNHGREAFTSYKVNGKQIFFPPNLEAAH
jgi:tungstate transport system substrate-binding protein